MLVDTHAHLTDERFSADLYDVIQKSFDSGIKTIITSGASLETSIKAVELAEKVEGIYASIGVHPQDADKYDEQTELTLEKLAQSKKVVAIGEIGLEYREGCPEKEIQKQTFLRQIKLANKLKLPIIIHTRDAIGDTLELLKSNKDLLTFGGTFHCFSESVEIAKEALKLGFYISVGGVSTFTNAKKVQEAIKTVPLEKILLETDCPYLAPTPHRGERNTPAYIPLIAENLAKLKGVSIDDIVEKTTENARRLFKF